MCNKKRCMKCRHRRQNFSSLQTFVGPKRCFGDSPGRGHKENARGVFIVRPPTWAPKDLYPSNQHYSTPWSCRELEFISRRNSAICIDQWSVPWRTGVPRTLSWMAAKAWHSATTWWEVSSPPHHPLHSFCIRGQHPVGRSPCVSVGSCGQ